LILPILRSQKRHLHFRDDSFDKGYGWHPFKGYNAKSAKRLTESKNFARPPLRPKLALRYIPFKRQKSSNQGNGAQPDRLNCGQMMQFHAGFALTSQTVYTNQGKHTFGGLECSEQSECLGARAGGRAISRCGGGHSRGGDCGQYGMVVAHRRMDPLLAQFLHKARNLR